MPSSTNVKHPMADLYHNVVPLLSYKCNASPNNCRCTDPSYSYSNPCSISSSSSSSPLQDSTKNHCYYGQRPSTTGISKSTGGSIGAKPGVQFKAGKGSNQYFTAPGSTTLLASAKAGPEYPPSLLFCNAPTQENASVNPETPALKYTNNNFGSTWNEISVPSNTSSNLGFA